MGCGCKQKKIDQARQAAQIKLTENPPPRPSEPIQTPVQEETDKIVEKLNAIFFPS
jgi:hypothetical protein